METVVRRHRWGGAGLIALLTTGTAAATEPKAPERCDPPSASSARTTAMLAILPSAAATPSPSAGMVWIAGGTFDMGANDPMFEDAQPVHPVSVNGFWMDETEADLPGKFRTI